MQQLRLLAQANPTMADRVAHAIAICIEPVINISLGYTTFFPPISELQKMQHLAYSVIPMLRDILAKLKTREDGMWQELQLLSINTKDTHETMQFSYKQKAIKDVQLKISNMLKNLDTPELKAAYYSATGKRS